MTIAQYIILAGGYIVGGAITSGVIGGVRDEMDGIGDMFCIVFWPLVVIVMIPVTILTLCYKLGNVIKKWLTRT